MSKTVLEFVDLMNEWVYQKNEELGLDPSVLTSGSNKKAWWKCSVCSGEYYSLIYERCKGTGCPYCAGRKVLVGFNDLATKMPELAKEWHPTQNGDLTPSDVTTGSNIKVWWKCAQGHEWQAQIVKRANGRGCPYCSNQRVKEKFNDLATKKPDLARQWHPTKNGNLTPKDVVCGSNIKVWWICEFGHEWEASVNKRVRGRGCPYCSRQKALSGTNDLATERPDLAKEWLFTKNGSLSPSMVTSGSNKKVWWKCPVCNGEYQARIADRVDSTGCPYCAGKKVLFGFNDLESLRPDLAAEWHPTKNGDLTPSDVTCGSNIKVWWMCSSGHEWETRVISRALQGYGCPYCSGSQVIVGETDLATTNPELVNGWWDFDKNSEIGLSPKEVSRGSKTVVWWRCPKGHSFKQPIHKRTSRKLSCPVCTGHLTVSGINDFATLFPEVAKEWHPTKNGDLKPSDFSKKNGRRVWWQCQYGHEWEQSIKERANGLGCPFCSSRRLTSFSEQAIFYYVKKLYPDAVNRYKDIFDNGMELDIYIPSIKFAIEFDGGYWHKGEDAHKKEIEKYSICQSNGITLHRVKESNDESWDDVADAIYYVNEKANRRNYRELASVITVILDYLNVNSNLLTSKDWINHRLVSVDIDRDYNEIKNYLTPISNSLYEQRPDLIEEWNYEKNGNLDPRQFSLNSNDVVWWKCKICGHEWKTSINQRGGKRATGCPECGKIRRGKSFSKNRAIERGSLADTNPELAKQWHPTKNGELTPNDVTLNSNKKVWWLCPKCGHEWLTPPNNRASGVGCPCCSGRVPKQGINDLKTVSPEIAEDWDYERNGDLRPEMFLPHSGKKVWWKCKECGSSWKSRILSRSAGHGCRRCMMRMKQSEKTQPLDGQIEFDF